MIFRPSWCLSICRWAAISSAACRRPENENPAAAKPGGVQIRLCEGRLLDLAFFEFHMLAQHGIVFLDRELLGHGAGVLLGDIEESGVARAVEPDFRGGGLRHSRVS